MFRIFTILFLLFFTQQIFAWEDHALLTRQVLNDWRAHDQSMAVYLDKKVKVESLKSFLEATRSSLPLKLMEIEHWAQNNEKGYQAIPGKLVYQPTSAECSADLDLCFRKSIRINLDLPLPAIVYDPEHTYAHQNGFVSVNSAREIMPAYIPLTFNVKDFTLAGKEGLLSVADIISTASMQADFGMDTFLYEDSQTAFGKIYGFGTQPMGNPGYAFHSQMMFHMSGFHEDARIAAAIPRLNENYPEYRAYLYLQLSHFAAENKHPYWAAVFMGWGLHYIQDMTQPYHHRLSYGLNTDVVIQALSEMAKKNYLPYFQLQTVQANRHMILENLTEYIASTPGAYRKIIHDSLVDRAVDPGLPACDVSTQYLRRQMSKDSPLDYQMLLQTTLPFNYVNSPQFKVEELSYENLFNKEMSLTQKQGFSEAVAKSLALYGAYTRACVKFYGGVA